MEEENVASMPVAGQEWDALEGIQALLSFEGRRPPDEVDPASDLSDLSTFMTLSGKVVSMKDGDGNSLKGSLDGSADERGVILEAAERGDQDETLTEIMNDLNLVKHVTNPFFASQNCLAGNGPSV